jgi:hypothetical protein
MTYVNVAPVPPSLTRSEPAIRLHVPMFPKIMILRMSISRPMAAGRRRRASEFGLSI